MARGFDNINLVFTIGNQTKDANKNVTARNEAQHSTVCFTKNLNITYRMSSPIKRLRGRQSMLRSNSPRKDSSLNDFENKIWNSKTCKNEMYQNEKRKMTSTSKVWIDDLTFWDKSCAVLLKYHRYSKTNMKIFLFLPYAHTRTHARTHTHARKKKVE